MTEASSAGLANGTFHRYAPPPGPLARIGTLLALIAEAFAEAQKMRQEARRKYPHLSDEA